MKRALKQTAALAATAMTIFSAMTLLDDHIAWAASVEDNIVLVEDAYKKISDIKGSFLQKNHIVEINRTDTYDGRFVIGIPSRMRWTFMGEHVQEVIITGREIIVYQEKEHQAFKRAFDRNNYGQVPVALISGLGDLRADFDISAAERGLMLKPKGTIGSVVTVELVLGKGEFPIERIIITDKFSNTVDITLRDVRTNTGLKGTEFVFTPPDGVAVHEQN